MFQVTAALCPSSETYVQFAARLSAGSLTRDEHPTSHLCAYFLPVNRKAGKVFVVHHKKADLWIAPGGHVDRGESLFEALNREVFEELGVPEFFRSEPLPFLCTLTKIANPKQPCKEHFDVWFMMDTDGADFHVDPKEFHGVAWATIPQARKLVTDPANLEALKRVEAML